METEQGEFKSAFDAFFSEPSDNEKSEERSDADAFEEEDGYEEDDFDDESEDLADDGFDDFDDDDEVSSDSDLKKMQKRIKDKDDYISKMRSENDQLKNQFNQMQQQLNYLMNNQNQTAGDDDDFEDLLGYDPGEYGTQEEFKAKEEKRSKLKSLKDKAKEAEQLKAYYNQMFQSEIQYTQSQSDYQDMIQYAQKIKSNKDPEIQKALQSIGGNEAATYYFLKMLKEQDRVKSFKKKVKSRTPVPPTDFKGPSSSKRRSPKSGGFADILMGHAASNMEKLSSFDLKK